MCPLAICLLITLIILLERSVFWIKNNKKRNKENLNALLKALNSNKYSEFINLCNKSDYLVNRILSKLTDSNEYNFKQNVEIAINNEYRELRRGHLILDTIISISPMIGILGTVIGIIISFQAMAMTGMENPKAVTEGIGLALITTATGLSIAIIALLTHNIFNSHFIKVSNELELYITELEKYIKSTEEKKINTNTNKKLPKNIIKNEIKKKK